MFRDAVQRWRQRRAMRAALRKLGYEPGQYDSARDTGAYYILHDRSGRTIVVDKSRVERT